jgi:crossover junction endodeoxyribonuclease RusA
MLKHVMVAAMEFYLPYPPTANNLFVNAGQRGRVRSKKYEVWRKLAGWKIKEQKVKPVPGLVQLEIYAVAPDKRKRDVANLEKAVADVLVTMGVIEDDSKIMRNVQEWATGNGECLVVVTPFTGVLREIGRQEAVTPDYYARPRREFPKHLIEPAYSLLLCFC